MPPPVPPKRETRPDDRRQSDQVERGDRLVEAVGDGGFGAFEPDAVHRLAEFEPVFGHFDRFGVGADQLHAEPLQRAVLGQSRAPY